MGTERERQTLWTVLGVSAGVLVGFWLWRRQRGYETDPGLTRQWSAPTNAGARVAAALRADPALSRQAIEVETLSDGVVELSGRVGTRDEAGRAVRVAQNTAGVFTVVNRLRANGDVELDSSAPASEGDGEEAEESAPVEEGTDIVVENEVEED